MASLDRTLASRHECKYFVPPDALPALRAMARPFVRPDEYTLRSGRMRYTLASLYLDGPDLPLYRGTVEGHRNRYKLRIRSYSDDPSAPVYCELKGRVDRIVRKLRVSVERSLAQRIAQDRAPLVLGDPKLGAFLGAQRDVAAGPMLRVRYEREAYESSAHDPVRMTIDSALSFAFPDPDAPFRIGGEGWHPTPLPGTIVELKFIDRCPSWMTRIVDELQLCRESIPKYVLSLERALQLGLARPALRRAMRSLGERLA
jgi:hypothetical protein